MAFKFSALAVVLTISMAAALGQSPASKKAATQKAAQPMASDACDCTVFPIRPEACVRVCRKMSGTVVSMTDNEITLQTAADKANGTNQSFKLDPALQQKIKIEPGTNVTVTYNKSNKVAKSVTVK